MNLVMNGIVGKTKRPWYKKWFFKKRDLSDSRYIYLWGHESLLSPREFNTVYNYVVGDCASMFSEKRQAAFDLLSLSQRKTIRFQTVDISWLDLNQFI